MAGFWDVINAGLDAARGAAQQTVQKAQSQQPAQKPATPTYVPAQTQASQATQQTGGVWQNLQQPAYVEQPTWSLPQASAPSEPQKSEEKPKEEKMSERTDASDSGKKKQNPSMFQQVLGSATQNPDVTDANNMAMPSGEQLQQLSPEEQQEWFDLNAPIADFIISNMLTAGIGGLAGNAVRGLMAGTRAGEAGVAATKAAANTAGKGVKAANAAKVGQAYADASPEARAVAQQAMKTTKEAGLDPNSASFLNALRQATNKLTPSAAEGVVAGAVPTAAVLGNSLIAPLVAETSASVKEGDEGKDEEKTASDEETVMGMTPDTWAALTQREQYNKALEDQILRDYYQTTYGDDIVGDLGYEYFRDLGEASDYSGKHDLVRDLFGYNRDAEGNSQYGISGWQDLAADSINGIGNMEDEEAIQAIMDYMWGAGNIIDPYQYIQDQSYQALHSLGSADAANYMGQYFGNNYFNGPGVENFLGTVTTQNGEQMYPMLDNADLGAWIMAGDLMNQNLAGYTPADMERLTNLLALAGENQLFGFANDDDNMNWNKTDWNSSGRNYSAQSLMDTLVANSAGQGVPLNIYNGPGNEDNALISADLADDLAAYISEQTGKTVGRRTKD